MAGVSLSHCCKEKYLMAVIIYRRGWGLFAIRIFIRSRQQQPLTVMVCSCTTTAFLTCLGAFIINLFWLVLYAAYFRFFSFLFLHTQKTIRYRSRCIVFLCGKTHVRSFSYLKSSRPTSAAVISEAWSASVCLNLKVCWSTNDARYPSPLLHRHLYYTHTKFQKQFQNSIGPI